MTRILDIAEILLFLGRVPTYWGYLGLVRNRWNGRLTRIALLGIVSLLLIFTSGAFRSSQTGRAAIFISPYLLLLAGKLLADLDRSPGQPAVLLLLVFIPGILMQLVGNYFW